MAVKNQQCDRCIHKEVCRHIETIEEIKKQYPFVSSVTCKHSIRRSATSTANLEPNTEEDQDDDKEKSAPAQKEKPATDEQKEAGNTGGDEDEPLTILDLDVGKIGLPDNKIVKALKGAGINTVKDVYEYQKDKDWSSVKNLTKDMLKKLSDLLTALSQPALNI